MTTCTDVTTNLNDTYTHKKSPKSQFHNRNILTRTIRDGNPADSNPNVYANVPVEVVEAVLEYANINHVVQRRTFLQGDRNNGQSDTNSDAFAVSHIDALRNIMDACVNASTHPSGGPPAHIIQYAKQKLRHVCDMDLSHAKNKSKEGGFALILTSTFVSIFSQTLRSINLSHCGLGLGPDDESEVLIAPIFQCRQLEELVLIRNEISILPDEIRNLIHLRRLDLSENQIQCLPHGLTTLHQNLTHLNVSHNQLATLYIQPNGRKRTQIMEEHLERHTEQNEMDWSEVWDDDRGRMVYYNRRTKRSTASRPIFSKRNPTTSAIDVELSPEQRQKLFQNMKLMVDGMEWEIKVLHDDKYDHGNLQCQVLYYNHLNGQDAQIPPKSLDCIGNLKGLTTLLIENNRIDQLPTSMGNLRLLRVLNVSRNQLSDIDTLANLCHLDHLNLSKNMIQETPSKMMCTSLRELDVSYNCLQLFPSMVLQMKDLERLDMSVNAIEKVPYNLGFLRTIKYLNANDNPIIDPPGDVMIKAASNAKQTLWVLRELSARSHKQDGSTIHSSRPEISFDIGTLAPIVPEHACGICSECNILEPDFQARLSELIHEANGAEITYDKCLNWQFKNLSWIPSELFQESSAIERIDLSHNESLGGSGEENGLTWSHPIVGLKELILRNCSLGVLSKSIHYLNNLVRLNLEENRIEIIPEEVTQLTSLEYLNLKRNQIKVMHSSLGRLKELRELHLESNMLHTIPESICSCHKMEVLTVSHNNIRVIEHAITRLPRLKILELRSNKIKILPNDVGSMEQLVKLSLSNNDIHLLEEECFCPRLCSSLEILELNDNKIEVLPGSVGKLKCIQFLDLNRNPLKSPPMSLGSEGNEALVKYCAAREILIQDTMRQLQEAGFGTSRSNFSPPATHVLIDGTSYLTNHDLLSFDETVDRSMNGSFYHKTTKMTTKKIVKDIKELRDVRERETQKRILDTFLGIIRLRLKENPVSDPEGGRVKFSVLHNVERRFNLLEGKVKCFAVPLNEVLLPDDESKDPGIMPSIFQEVKEELHELDSAFNFDNDALLWAFKYISPFGRISSQEKMNYSKEDGSAMRKKSLIVAQYIYSDEEAKRKTEEEDTLKEYFAKMIKKIDIWATSKPGRRSINTEAVSNMREITRNVPRCKQELDKYRLKSKMDLKKMQKRYDNYQSKKPLRYHLIKSDEDAEKLFHKINTHAEDTEVEIRSLEEKFKAAKDRKDNMLPKEEIAKELIEHMKKKCCFSLFEKVNRNGRAYALVNGLQRPWEIQAFNDYKERCEEKKDSRVVVDRETLKQQLEQCVTCTSMVWTNMDDMTVYDCEIYDQLKDTSLLNKAKDLLKRGE